MWRPILARGGMALRRSGAVILKQRQPQQYLPRQPQYRTMVQITQTKAADNNMTPVTPMDSTVPVTKLSPSTLQPSSSSSQQQPSLTITDACWNRIRELNTVATNKKFLRIVVDAGGCSGFSYQFELDETIDDENDLVLLHHNNDDTTDATKVVVDLDSLELIRGSTIDYEVSMMKSAFKVMENPQSESACGCGSSFAVKKFAAAPALD